jgi:response regulator RpfG family c-di-GMP phosphodiesterase
MSQKPIVLFVDDEPAAVEGLQLTQRKQYEVRVAHSGAGGLEILRKEPDIAVVVSDMRMPDMDGATFLSEVRRIAPDVVRILLTGYADIEDAVRAVNEGRIFHYLSKPCAPAHMSAALASAAEMHRLIAAERTLLQKTLVGSVKAVVNVLGLTKPAALGRSIRVRDRARKAAETLNIEDRWSLEFAALLSQVGAAALPDRISQKLNEGKPLTKEEQTEFVDSIEAVNRVLRSIPRLEPVTKLLDELMELTVSYHSDSANVPRTSANARLLHAIIDLEALEAGGKSFKQALDHLQRNDAKYGAEALAALNQLVADPTQIDVAMCSPAMLTDGMVLAEDLTTTDGLLLLPRGFELSQSSREHIVNKFKDRLPERIKVHVAPQNGTAHRRAHG